MVGKQNRRSEEELRKIKRAGKSYCTAFEIIIVFGIVALVLALCGGLARSRELDGQYANSPNSEWIKSLRNKSGTPCCDVADGHRLEDVDWRGEPDGTYSVRIEGNWVKLSQDQILTEPNKIGVTMVWIYMGRVTCFLAGAGI